MHDYCTHIERYSYQSSLGSNLTSQLVWILTLADVNITPPAHHFVRHPDLHCHHHVHGPACHRSHPPTHLSW